MFETMNNPSLTEQSLLLGSFAPSHDLSARQTRSLSILRRRWQDILSCVALCLVFGTAFMAFAPLFSSTEMDMAPPYYYSQFKMLRSWKKQRAQGVANDFALSILSPEGQQRHHHHPPIAAPDGCEGTVLILRHCEKGEIRSHCSYMGYERAIYLSTLFGDHDERWPAPSYIFAESPGGRNNPRKMNYREIETIQPTADKLNLSVNRDYDSTTVSKLAKHLLELFREGEMCGKLAVVVWKHSDIPKLANKLGCGPLNGCPLDYPGISFDEAWEIKILYDKMLHSTSKKGKPTKYSVWNIFGSVQQEHFDPLSFSKKRGDYPPGGKNTATTWGMKVGDVTEKP